MKGLKYTIIKNEAQYNEYCDLLESKVLTDRESDIEEIDLLGLLIDDYNRRNMQDFKMELNPVEVLRQVILENNLTQKELAKRIGISPQLLTDILKYRREITKKVAHNLADTFKLNYSVFLRSYPLKVSQPAHHA